MNEKILPLGTVVTLKNGDGSNLMIVSRASIIEENEKEVYFDYASVLIPQGMISPENIYFFNRENVKDIVFKGFENYDEEQFAEQYNTMIKSAKITKGCI